MPPEGRELRRGRCPVCYEAWVRARPVGVGAICAGCNDRRLFHLRHYELGLKQNVPGGRWIVLCHNCVAFADNLHPPARSVEGLRMRLYRERRWGDRRAAAVGRDSTRDSGLERRGSDRRSSDRNVFDATDLAEEILVELEAEYEEITPDQIACQEEITGIHMRM